jgi:Domain of unknown function (DUF5658)
LFPNFVFRPNFRLEFPLIMTKLAWGILFTLNLLDALMTIYWVRNGFATEGNQLMAGLLDMGDTPFLIVKIAIGGVTAVVLSRFGNMKLAKYGLYLAIGIYASLMFVHLVTGLSAFGYISEETVNKFSLISSSSVALFT